MGVEAKNAIDSMLRREKYDKNNIKVGISGDETNLYVGGACISILCPDDTFIIGSGTGSKTTFEVLKELLSLADCKLYLKYNDGWRTQYGGLDRRFSETSGKRFEIKKYITLETIKEYYKIPRVFKVKK